MTIGGLIVRKQKVAHEVVFSLILLFIAIPCLGQKAAQRTETAQDAERPRSLVTLELSLADEPPVTITVVDGTLATYERADRAYRVGLIPHVVDEASGEVEIELVSFSPRGDFPVSRLSLGSVDAMVGFRTSTAEVGRQVLDITVTDVGTGAPAWLQSCSGHERHAASSPVPHANDQFEEENQSTGCCVSCGGASFCGCAVSTSCGQCCNCSFC